jgi:hypothetical protein
VIDIPRTQQIVEYNKTALVTKFIPRDILDRYFLEKLDNTLPYSTNQICGFFETIHLMNEKNVTFEVYLGNIIYNSQNGFTPIDYRTQENNFISFMGLKNLLFFNMLGVRNVFTDDKIIHKPELNTIYSTMKEAFMHFRPKEAKKYFEDWNIK